MDIAAAILAAEDNRTATVLVREWGGLRVRLKSWTASERIAFDQEGAFLEEYITDDDGAVALLWSRVVARSVINEDGSLAFNVPSLKALKEAAKAEALEEALKVYLDLAQKNAKGLFRVYKVAMELNGFTADDELETGKN